MPEKRDYYEVLGVSRNATKDDIKKAYRRLAREYHPDVSKLDRKVAEEKFKELSEAYEVLVDDEKRKLYDTYGMAGVQSTFREGGFQWTDFTHFSDLEDIFGGFADFGLGGSIFDQFFGSSSRRTRRGPIQGESLRYDLEISLEDAYRGAEKEIMVPHMVACRDCRGSGSADGKLENCDACGGSGQIRRSQTRGFAQYVTVTTCPKCRGSGRKNTNPCRSCGGTGQRQETSRIVISIPKGADTGMRLRVRGAGEPGPEGGPPGDLYVIVHVAPHHQFLRDGNDLLIEVPVTISQAALGDEVKIPTMDGNAMLTIPPGTQSGTIFRLRGRGMPDVAGRGRGDILAKVVVSIPKRLTREQKNLLKQLDESLGDYADRPRPPEGLR
ncbi:MAG: molecular chaperone DnaJ [Thermoplasmata archaeon]